LYAISQINGGNRQRLAQWLLATLLSKLIQPFNKTQLGAKIQPLVTKNKHQPFITLIGLHIESEINYQGKRRLTREKP
jgi:hypothetical protein